MWIRIIAFLAALAPAQALAQAATPLPATVRMADDEAASREVVGVGPTTPYKAPVSGHVTLSCLVDVHGLAERCRVASETPKNQGLGDVALELRPTLKLTPAKGADGAPTRAQMSIALAFKAGESQFDGETFYRQQAAILKGPTGGVGSTVDIGLTGDPTAVGAVDMLDHPLWAEAAGFDDLAHAYPAKGAGVEGYAAARCRVERSGDQTGRLKDCQVIKESPDGHDFGKAALSLTPKFRLSSGALAKAPGRGPVWVNIPIRLPPPAELSDRAVAAPDWILRVDPKDTPRVFPPQAAAAGLTTGVGAARCKVIADGAMDDCAPEPGAPDGQGFSEAAAMIASGMRMNLWSADGAPVEGGVVHVALRLDLQRGAK